MEYKHFLSALMTYQKAERDLTELSDLGFNFFDGKYELSNLYIRILEATIKSHYGKDGWDWVEWYMWENDWGEKVWKVNDKIIYGARDESGNPIAYSFESLYNLLEKDYKKKKK